MERNTKKPILMKKNDHSTFADSQFNLMRKKNRWKEINVAKKKRIEWTLYEWKLFWWIVSLFCECAKRCRVKCGFYCEMERWIKEKKQNCKPQWNHEIMIVKCAVENQYKLGQFRISSANFESHRNTRRNGRAYKQQQQKKNLV